MGLNELYVSPLHHICLLLFTFLLSLQWTNIPKGMSLLIDMKQHFPLTFFSSMRPSPPIGHHWSSDYHMKWKVEVTHHGENSTFSWDIPWGRSWFELVYRYDFALRQTNPVCATASVMGCFHKPALFHLLVFIFFHQNHLLHVLQIS